VANERAQHRFNDSLRRAPPITLVALPRRRLGLRVLALILGEGFADIDLIARKLPLVISTNVSLVTLMGLNQLTLSAHDNLRT
jgi:hypothetical protein